MRKIFFDHIPKVAGTAVTRAMLSAIGPEAQGMPDLRLLGHLPYANLVREYADWPYIGAQCGFDAMEQLAPDRIHCVLP